MAAHRSSAQSGRSVAQSQLSEAQSEESYVAAAGGKRGYVLYELFDTEQIYVKDLDILVAVFAVLLRKHVKPWSTQTEQMLRPLEVLFAFQCRFLKSLCGRTSVAATAQLFLAESHKFAVYIDYCGTYHWLCDLLERLKADSAWPNVEDEFQQKMAQYSDKRRLGLRDFLIKPVQRICKYPLFLKELLKYTDVRLESSTFDELNQALTLLKGVCEGVDQVQQRIDSLRLRNTLLSSYCDSPELPLYVVAKLGEVVLSGPLYIAGCSDKGLEPLRPLGCVLFKLFLLILKPRRSGILVPQFWFPLHTMQVTDDGLVHSWQLQHVKSGQFMVFQASSPHEKQIWTDALKGAIVDSTAYVKRRQAKYANAAASPSHQQQRVANHATDRVMSGMSSGSGSAQVTPVLNAAAIAAVTAITVATPSPLPRPTGSRSFWSSNPFALTKSALIETHFKEYTSPEILRLRTAEALKHNAFSKTFLSSCVPSPPRAPLLAASHSPEASPTNDALINNRPSNGSYPSHTTATEQCAEADGNSDEYGAFSISSTCHEPIQQHILKHQHEYQCTNYSDENGRRRSFSDIQDRIAATGCAPAATKGSLSERLFGALSHFHTLKRKATATQIEHFDEHVEISTRHGRSFSVGASDGKC
ncbi:hypothetical protein IW139_002241 [Coemansia sp. RSA 353]|nr:hypothetical protein IW139_002241 [Coemansia sp. RSA 353]KAJ2434074.1 hypothetical protein IWW41_001683 [Coemansia sp. RSA 2522]